MVMRDNGSNMIRAFKEHLYSVDSEEDEEEGGNSHGAGGRWRKVDTGGSWRAGGR